MVSLSEDSRRSGGFFFDEQSHNHSMSAQDSNEVLYDPSSGPLEAPFKKIHTIWMIVVSILLMLCLEACLFVVPSLCPVGSCGALAHSAILYAHGIVWFLLLIADRYWRVQHYFSRTYGYLDFYRRTRRIRRSPLAIFSGGSALLLVLSTVLNDYCQDTPQAPPSDSCRGIPLSKTNILQIVISVETVIILVFLVIYLVRTVKFNRAQQLPDVHQEESMAAFLHAQISYTSSDVGYRDESLGDEVMEKQADLIRYLRQHNEHLGRKVIQLVSQLHAQTPP